MVFYVQQKENVRVKRLTGLESKTDIMFIQSDGRKPGSRAPTQNQVRAPLVVNLTHSFLPHWRKPMVKSIHGIPWRI